MNIGYAPIFYYQPHRAPSGLMYAKAVAQDLTKAVNDGEGMDVFVQGKPDPVAILLEAKLDEKGSAVVGKFRLLDESLKEYFNPVDMWFTVAIVVKPAHEDVKVVGRDHIKGLGPAYCGVYDGTRTTVVSQGAANGSGADG